MKKSTFFDCYHHVMCIKNLWALWFL